jgi:hypothetical protein
MEVIETENIQIAEVTPKASLPEKASHVLSAIFNPFLVPSYAFVLLFAFTYLNIMPIQYVLFVLSIVASFTIISPWLFNCLYKWMNKWSMREINERKKRFIPYLLTLMSYGTCFILMHRMHFPTYFSGIIAASLMCMGICALLNLRWRMSIHLAGCGMFIGGLLAYSLLFLFNPVWWLCGFILLTGIQGTARISYHQLTLLEVIVGFVVGMFCGIVGILFI